MVLISLLILSISSIALGQSFDLASINKAIDLIKESIKLNEEDKSIKAKKLEKEAERILGVLFKENKVIESEFVKTDKALGYNNAFYFTETDFNPLFRFYNDIGRNSIRTPDEIIEKFEDCSRFKAIIRIIKYLDLNVKPYTIYGSNIHIDCKILSITPIVETNNPTEEKSE